MKPSILAAAVLVLAAPPAWAQAALPTVYEASTPAAGVLPAPALDALVAPIALYPDPLLTDILAASTYPAQVVEAARWLADPAHAGLRGQALADAAAAENWDPSVQALTAFPQVLAMMDKQLSWTDRLGRAFVAQQADVMNAVQRLRHAAQFAGALQNGPQDNVVNDGDNIAIYPPSPQQFYVPSYDAACVYGPNAGCDAADDFVGWDAGFFLPYGYLQWGFVDWRDRAIHFDHNFHDRAGDYGSDWHHGAAGGHGTGGGEIWHHSGTGLMPGTHGFGAPGAFGGHFQYAPPATQLLGGNRQFVGHGIGVPVLRANGVGPARGGAPHPVAAAHFAGVAHGGAGGGGRVRKRFFLEKEAKTFVRWGVWQLGDVRAGGKGFGCLCVMGIE